MRLFDETIRLFDERIRLFDEESAVIGTAFAPLKASGAVPGVNLNRMLTGQLGP